MGLKKEKYQLKKRKLKNLQYFWRVREIISSCWRIKKKIRASMKSYTIDYYSVSGIIAEMKRIHLMESLEKA